LKDQLAGRQIPAPRRCKDCDEFLASHEALTLTCQSCAAPIHWSGYEQLLHALGTFAKPTHCPACNDQIMRLDRPPEPEEREHHLVIRVPSAGRWHEDDVVRSWPPHMTPATIAKAEKADIRIVAFGDDLTYGTEEHGETWPAMLEQKLEAKLGKSVCVVNAGIPGCTSHQALLRVQRDVLPFEPHAVLFSFAFADALLDPQSGGDEFRGRYPLDRTYADMERLWRELAKLSGKAVYWTPNPIFPETADDEFGQPSPAWARQQSERMDHVLRHARHCCTETGTEMADFHSRFAVNGRSSARHWMKDWFRHNHAGSANIAAWFVDFLVNGGLVPKD
jgi:lysophospholipase L1-like esterase